MPPDAEFALASAERRLNDIGRRTLVPQTVDELRGLEGEAGQVYFAVFRHLVRVDDPAFRFLADRAGRRSTG